MLYMSNGGYKDYLHTALDNLTCILQMIKFLYIYMHFYSTCIYMSNGEYANMSAYHLRHAIMYILQIINNMYFQYAENVLQLLVNYCK